MVVGYITLNLKPFIGPSRRSPVVLRRASDMTGSGSCEASFSVLVILLVMYASPGVGLTKR